MSATRTIGYVQTVHSHEARMARVKKCLRSAVRVVVCTECGFQINGKVAGVAGNMDEALRQ